MSGRKYKRKQRPQPWASAPSQTPMSEKLPDKKKQETQVIETVVEMNEYSAVPNSCITWEDPPQTDMDPYITFVAINGSGQTVTSVRFYYRDLIEIFERMIADPSSILKGAPTQLPLKKLMVICGCFRRLPVGIMLPPWTLDKMCTLHFGDNYMTVFMAAGMPYTIDTPGIDQDMPDVSYFEAIKDRISRVRTVCFGVIDKFWGSIRGLGYFNGRMTNGRPSFVTVPYFQLIEMLEANPDGIFVNMKMTMLNVVFFSSWNQFITFANAAANFNSMMPLFYRMKLPKQAVSAVLGYIADANFVEFEVVV